MTGTTPGELDLDVLGGEGETGGDTVNDGSDRSAMGFSVGVDSVLGSERRHGGWFSSIGDLAELSSLPTPDLPHSPSTHNPSLFYSRYVLPCPCAILLLKTHSMRRCLVAKFEHLPKATDISSSGRAGVASCM